MEKTCKICNESKPLTVEFFDANKRMKDGFNSKCKACRAITRPEIKAKHWSGDLLICLRCGESKSLTEFSDNQFNIHRQGKDRNCKPCRNQVAANRKRNCRGKENIDSIINYRYGGILERAKKKGWIVDFEKAYLKELWIKQQGLCAISKIPMTFKLFTGRVPTNMSVDRIDSDKGYVRGNVHLVCFAVNQMKSDLDMDTLLYFCREILDHAE